LLISRFDPVLVEPYAVFVAPGTLQVLSSLGTAMNEPIGGGLLLGLAPFGPFPHDSKVNDGGHGKTSKDQG